MKSIPAWVRSSGSRPPAGIIRRVLELPFGLRPYLLGGGQLDGDREQLRLTLPPTPSGYADAQLDDYQGLHREQFPWKPPLRLSLEARASSPRPAGTLGFGFWNDPFAASLGLGGASRRLPAGPQAVWLFYGSPPNQLAFRPRAVGHGWLAAVLDSPALSPMLLVPLAAGALVLSRLPPTRRLVIGAIQRVMTASEAELSAKLDEWHGYEIEWTTSEARFRVDGVQVLRVSDPPAGPLGFVAWIDNQFAAISPEHGIRFGVLPTEAEQWLELRRLVIEEAVATPR